MFDFFVLHQKGFVYNKMTRLDESVKEDNYEPSLYQELFTYLF